MSKKYTYDVHWKREDLEKAADISRIREKMITSMEKTQRCKDYLKIIEGILNELNEEEKETMSDEEIITELARLSNIIYGKVNEERRNYIKSSRNKDKDGEEHFEKFCSYRKADLKICAARNILLNMEE